MQKIFGRLDWTLSKFALPLVGENHKSLRTVEVNGDKGTWSNAPTAGRSLTHNRDYGRDK